MLNNFYLDKAIREWTCIAFSVCLTTFCTFYVPYWKFKDAFLITALQYRGSFCVKAKVTLWSLNFLSTIWILFANKGLSPFTQSLMYITLVDYLKNKQCLIIINLIIYIYRPARWGFGIIEVHLPKAHIYVLIYNIFGWKCAYHVLLQFVLFC